MSKYKCLIIGIFIGFAGVVGWFLYKHAQPIDTYSSDVQSFAECEAAGFPVMESYPRQCRDASGTLFVEDVPPIFPISYVNATADDIVVDNITIENNVIASPLTITGEARGWWYFEASFPIVLTDWDGLIIAEGFATAQDEWMTEDLVPFSATLTFEKPFYGERGTLILKRDNPSGLPEHDASLEIPVRFE